MQKERDIEELPTASWLKFLLPSGIGIAFFLTPLVIDGQITVGMAGSVICLSITDRPSCNGWRAHSR